jgi:Leucine-rich repeat (LRR) protein
MLRVASLHDSNRLAVFPGDPQELKELRSLDLSKCSALYDISGVMGASHLQWLDLSSCKALSNVSPIAGCSELRTLNLSVCTSLHELSALGVLAKLEVLDLSEYSQLPRPQSAHSSCISPCVYVSAC